MAVEWTSIRLPADVYFSSAFNQWLHKHTMEYTIDDYREVDYSLRISFADAKIAVLCKLTWGGEKPREDIF